MKLKGLCLAISGLLFCGALSFMPASAHANAEANIFMGMMGPGVYNLPKIAKLFPENASAAEKVFYEQLRDDLVYLNAFMGTLTQEAGDLCMSGAASPYPHLRNKLQEPLYLERLNRVRTNADKLSVPTSRQHFQAVAAGMMGIHRQIQYLASDDSMSYGKALKFYRANQDVGDTAVYSIVGAYCVTKEVMQSAGIRSYMAASECANADVNNIKRGMSYSEAMCKLIYKPVLAGSNDEENPFKEEYIWNGGLNKRIHILFYNNKVEKMVFTY